MSVTLPVIITQADARHIPLPDESVQCVVTSPPYWGLRDYGLEGSVWGGTAGCRHAWGERQDTFEQGNQRTPSFYDGVKYKPTHHQKQAPEQRTILTAFCRLCGAWRGTLGLEPTPELYCEHMVEVFREVRRVLRSDGTVWLNLGDSYASHDPGPYREGEFLNPGGRQPAKKGRARNRAGNYRPPGLKPKDLVGIPWRVAFALQADGWWLRSDIIWHKPNPMPESVTDRPTKSHEYLFLLTKSKRYYFDQDAVREEHSGYERARADEYKKFAPPGQHAHSGLHRSHEAGRNIRSVWRIATKPYRGAHFAVMPPALVEPCIKAGTSEKGACPECGKAWERETSKTKTWESGSGRSGNPITGKQDLSASETNSTPDIRMGPTIHSTTTGWRPGCSCGTMYPIPQAGLDADPTLLDDFEIEPYDPVPCLCLDPFGGAGTVGLVAMQLGRRAVLTELNREYCQMAWDRVTPGATVTAQPEPLESLPMFAGGAT